MKRSRARTDSSIIESYFEHLSKSIDSIPPNLIYNCDETNLQDDPGKKISLMKRGTKYPTRIINHTKSAVSLMFTGTADGELLPLYVVYKAENLYDSWCRNGPPGTRYGCSKSGWFETENFCDYFRTVLLPHMRRKEGRKVVICDNLSTHLSEEVFKLCKRHNILFSCLPPYSTDKTQPLDVSYFCSLKANWRAVLQSWKLQNAKESSLPKSVFPSLLKQLMAKMKTKNEGLLLSGFKKTGICPLDKNKVLATLPESSSNARSLDNSVQELDSALLQLVKNATGRQDGPARKKGKRLKVTPGKSVVDMAEEDSNEESEESHSPDHTTEETTQEDAGASGSKDRELPIKPLLVSNWIVVAFEAATTSRALPKKQQFVGQVVKKVSNSVYEVKFLRPAYSHNKFKYVWPQYDDQSFVEFENIVKKLPEPRYRRQNEVLFSF